jgi:broad specificity phosphatase PhoE
MALLALPKRLILIRHGETEWNRERRLNSRTDLPLSYDGTREIEQLAHTMKTLRIDRVYSSPQRRAMQTATILAADRHGAVVPDDRLREVDFGPFEGLSAETLEGANATGAFDDWLRGAAARTAEGAEPLEDAAERARSFFSTVATLSGTTLVVGHGYLLRILLTTCVLVTHVGLFRRLKVDNASVSIVEWYGDNGEPVLVMLNGKGLSCLDQSWSDTKADSVKLYTQV